MEIKKKFVYDFWNNASCGEELYMKGKDIKSKFINQMNERYKLEPEILSFAKFDSHKGEKVLEIGVGLGSDHQKWAESGVTLYGCDLTDRAVSYTKQRLSLFGLSSNLQVCDAENLPYENEIFDLIYSWGVIHHSPNPPKIVEEIYRTLKYGGYATIMIYHKYSMVGYMLWFRYAFLKFKPFTSLNEIYAKYLESPGTKAYSRIEAEQLFKKFEIQNIKTPLGNSDLITSNVGQRHRGMLLNIAKKLYPRWLVRTFMKNNGLFLMVNLKKV